MATRAATNVSTAITPTGALPVAFGQGGMLIEVWRCAGGTAGDTSVITPQYITDIRTVQTEHATSNALSTSAANTNVTLTYEASNSSTSVFFDVWLIGNR